VNVNRVAFPDALLATTIVMGAWRCIPATSLAAEYPKIAVWSKYSHLVASAIPLAIGGGAPERKLR
jgi:hypothetical protein